MGSWIWLRRKEATGEMEGEREMEGGREGEGEGERENGGGGRVRLKVGSETLRDRVAPIICYFYFTIKICT